ncbi:MAG: putative DNA binding domain-containing protein [Deltaproteobacteria bacterium]|jgi:predicted HTH transcriptional regulator|nr:putative DNA binding domain-containing protein [Deltaproteobacteria bacterium]MDL1986653.1 putative DNA binding domain-containing protein [Deltaproteobacteria bacterium]
MFDSQEELLAKIRLGEDSILELKAVSFRGNKIAGPKRDDLADEMAAFGNSFDGVLLLGVDDKTREVEGIPLDKLDVVETFVRDICNDSIDPPLNVRIVRMMLPDSQGIERAIIKMDIPRSLFVHKSSRGYFHRLGSSKREMIPDYLARLFQQRSQARLIRFEEQSVPQSSMNDLSEDFWRKFTTRSKEPSEVVLLKRNLLSKEESGVVRASVAGILFCCEHPERFLPSAFIEAVRYRGTRQDSNYQTDAQRIRGPLDQQIKQAMAFLKKNQTVKATKEPHRVEMPQFSEKAVFEAVVNAVAHRDYSVSGSKIRFFMFDDRLEIYSPGALPNTVTVESIALRQATRNELITSLLAESPVAETIGNVERGFYMEKRGDGVPIILNESTKLSGKTPVYQLIDESELLLTIYAAKNA